MVVYEKFHHLQDFHLIPVLEPVKPFRQKGELEPVGLMVHLIQNLVR